MTTLDTQRESRGEGFREAETPQVVRGDTRTVSTEVPVENAYLDKKLSNPFKHCSIFWRLGFDMVSGRYFIAEVDGGLPFYISDEEAVIISNHG